MADDPLPESEWETANSAFGNAFDDIIMRRALMTPAERVADDVRLRAELQRIDRLNAARKADEYRGKATYWQGIADG